MPETDNTTTAILDELEAWRKRTEDHHFVTKQLLKGNTCDKCWRLTKATCKGEIVFFCGSIQIDKKVKDVGEVSAILNSPLPEEKTCEFYVSRSQQRENKKFT